MMLRVLEDDNTKLDKRDRVTIDSIRNHCSRHFPVQNFARATYREILERRAKENGIDFVNGVATAITPMAYYETLMAKGYETIVGPGHESGREHGHDRRRSAASADRIQGSAYPRPRNH
jgi:hypothetical protein